MSEQKQLPSGISLDDAEKQLKEFLETHGCEIGYDFKFPVYKILPDEVKLALLILSKHQMTVAISLKPKATTGK